MLASILSQLRVGGCTYFIDKLHRNMLVRKMTIKKEEEEKGGRGERNFLEGVNTLRTGDADLRF